MLKDAIALNANNVTARTRIGTLIHLHATDGPLKDFGIKERSD